MRTNLILNLVRTDVRYTYAMTLTSAVHALIKATCPTATQDVRANLENRAKAIETASYGPLNPSEPNDDYWAKLGAEWGVSAEDAKKQRCGNCVIKALRYKYKDAKYRMKKSITDEAFVQSFRRLDIRRDPYVRYDMAYYEKNGVTIEHVEEWCKDCGIAMYAVDMNTMPIRMYVPPHSNHHAPALCFMMTQGHMYLLCGRVKHYSNNGKNKSFKSTTVVTKTQETFKNKYNAEEAVYHENVEDGIKFMVDMVHKKNKMIDTPYANIVVVDRQLQSFKLDGKTHYINQNKDKVEAMCSRMGLEFAGQTAMGLMIKIMEDVLGGKKSYFSPKAYSILVNDSQVKNRAHIGLVGTTEEEVRELDKEGRLHTYDINKCYTACMLNMTDDLMLFNIGDDFVRYNGNKNNGGNNLGGCLNLPCAL